MSLQYMLSQFVIRFASCCPLRVPNNGNSSALMLMSLSAGYNLTTNSWLQLTNLPCWSLLYSLSIYCVENTMCNNSSNIASSGVAEIYLSNRWQAMTCLFIEPFLYNGQCPCGHAICMSLF
jgi:hypothetical protein